MAKDSQPATRREPSPSEKAPPNSLLIRGGRVIDPATNTDAELDLLLRDGSVAEIAPGSKLIGHAAETLDARGLIVAPGFIDLHVHLREPGQSHKETIATGTAAAGAGGFTSVCPMPNTSPVNDSVETVTWMQQAARGAVVNVFPIAAATVGSNGEQLSDFYALQRAGAVAFTDDGRPILDDKLMREALSLGARLKAPIVQHAEDTRMTAGASMNDGPMAFRLGLRGMPVEAESRIVERDIELARATQGHLHVAHLSTAAALKAVRRGKKDRVRVTCEVTPHHFTLLDENVGEYDSNYKMNPPLRSVADREALLAALADGAIDAIATDHAPHAEHEKQVEFDRAPFGIIGLETALALTITRLHCEKNIPLRRLIELLSTNPARIMNLRGRGTLAPGSHADVVIFDPKKRWTYNASESLSKSRNTPFDGWTFTGKVMATIVGGNFVYRSS
ncbi:MAG: dihydroorotase [Acidobacteriia bacterium]|nr:dihydroorotase [Terriglobia bacterium]